MTSDLEAPAVGPLGNAPASRPDPALPGFEHRFAAVDGVRPHYVTGGRQDGETIILLAGFPESWFAWRKVMALLAPTFRIIAPDLPGQGDSDRPAAGYDTRSLATAVHGLLRQLGVIRYGLAGHDVGAWVAYLYAALFGDEFRGVALLDAGIPGITLPDALPTDPDRSWRTWHLAFHALPDLPELLIGGRERPYLDWFLRRKTANPEAFSDADIDEYLRVFSKAGGQRAGLGLLPRRHCAGAAEPGLRRWAQAGDAGAGARLALGANQGSIADMAAPLRAYAEDVRGVVMAHCGHFIPEEQPVATARELAAFFGAP